MLCACATLRVADACKRSFLLMLVALGGDIPPSSDRRSRRRRSTGTYIDDVFLFCSRVVIQSTSCKKSDMLKERSRAQGKCCRGLPGVQTNPDSHVCPAVISTNRVTGFARGSTALGIPHASSPPSHHSLHGVVHLNGATSSFWFRHAV